VDFVALAFWLVGWLLCCCCCCLRSWDAIEQAWELVELGQLEAEKQNKVYLLDSHASSCRIRSPYVSAADTPVVVCCLHLRQGLSAGEAGAGLKKQE